MANNLEQNLYQKDSEIHQADLRRHQLLKEIKKIENSIYTDKTSRILIKKSRERLQLENLGKIIPLTDTQIELAIRCNEIERIDSKYKVTTKKNLTLFDNMVRDTMNTLSNEVVSINKLVSKNPSLIDPSKSTITMGKRVIAR